MSWPSAATIPSVGGVSPIITFMSEVLPHPEGPVIAKQAPARTDSETPRKIQGSSAP